MFLLCVMHPGDAQRVCCISLFKTLWEKEVSFFQGVFYLFQELTALPFSSKLKLLSANSLFGRVYNLSFGNKIMHPGDSLYTLFPRLVSFSVVFVTVFVSFQIPQVRICGWRYKNCPEIPGYLI